MLTNDSPILGFVGEYRFLSNFYPCKILYQGIYYPSVENAYVASKTLDIELRKTVSTCSAVEAKKIGKTFPLREDWESVKVKLMYEFLKQKFYSGELCDKLLSTGDSYIEETNHWNDRFWGVCDGRGENILGRLLMNIRDDLNERKING